MKDSIKIYVYTPLNTVAFRDTLECLYRSSEHSYELEFVEWDCFNAEPEFGGDLYIYDAALVSYMAEKGYVRRLPDIIDTSALFPWLQNTIKHERKNYAFPVIICCNVIICRQEDDFGIENVFELPGPVGAPVKSLISNYYFNIRCNREPKSGVSEEQRQQSIREDMKKLVDMIGGKDRLEMAKVSKNFGIKEYNERRIRYYIGFTETLQQLDRENCVIRKARYSESYGDSISLMYVNVISLGKNVTEKKLLDCIDLIELMTTPEFESLLCNPGGRLTYMLPTNRKAYAYLIEKDRLYEQLYALASDERNFTYRVKNYYETVGNTEKELLEMLL